MHHKKFLHCILITTALAVGKASAENQERERLCLAIGKYAEVVVENRELGRSEIEALDTLSLGKKSPTNIAFRQVVEWVYTANPSPSEARKSMYLKCLNRELLSYNLKSNR